MKSFVVLALLVITLFPIQGISDVEAKEAEVEAVVEGYFEYLKAGDTAGVLSLIADPLLSERRELLEKNTAYAEFLRDMYKNSYMKITNIKNIKGNKKAADVEIYLNEEETPIKTRLILQIINGSWKISNEVNDA